MTEHPTIKKTTIMGINISLVNLEQLLAFIMLRSEQKILTLVNHVNVHGMSTAWRNPLYSKVLNNSDVVFCDGFGVKLAASVLGAGLSERMTAPDWIDTLFDQCVKHSQSVFIIGDEPGVAVEFERQAQDKHPNLHIAGTHNGFFDMQGEENNKIIEIINKSNADIILTGMGMPRQEIWAYNAKDHLQHGVIIATGALFRWYTGLDNRDPRWLTDHGFEWLVQLVRKPKERFSRYLFWHPIFFMRVFYHALFKKRKQAE